MIDPNRGISKELLDRAREESEERFRLQVFNAVEKILDDLDMTWDDLTFSIPGFVAGEELRRFIGTDQGLTLKILNDVASSFGCEPYIIFRPRSPHISA